MLTRLIVNFYAWIIEITLWLMILISSVAGYHYAVPLLKAAGGIVEFEAPWKFVGAVLFAAGAFVLLAVLTGPFLVLVEIRKSVAAIESQNNGRSGGRSSSGVAPVEPREPSM